MEPDPSVLPHPAIRRARVGGSVARRTRLDARRSHGRSLRRRDCAAVCSTCCPQTGSAATRILREVDVASRAFARAGMPPTTGGTSASCASTSARRWICCAGLGFDEPDWQILGYLLSAGFIAWLIVIAWQVEPHVTARACGPAGARVREALSQARRRRRAARASRRAARVRCAISAIGRIAAPQAAISPSALSRRCSRRPAREAARSATSFRRAGAAPRRCDASSVDGVVDFIATAVGTGEAFPARGGAAISAPSWPSLFPL